MPIQPIHETDSYGGYGRFYLRVEAECADRKFDDVDYDNIRPHVQAIERVLHARTFALDPKIQAQAATDKERLLLCFGDEKIWVQPIENRYHGPNSPYGSMFPWFDVTTTRGIFLVGWRKRVIQLDWSRTNVNVDADTLFPEDKVTKHAFMIHAWSYEDLKRYITTILEQPR